MIEAEIEQFVRDHYSRPQPGVLLLSNLGMHLGRKGVWPPEGEKRSLHEIVEAMDTVSIVREDDTSSFIAITLAGDEQRAHAVIADRANRFFLRGLPRPLLLAFTLSAEGQVVSVAFEPKVRFRAAAEAPEGMVLVDEDLRLPGLDIGDLSSVEPDAIARLEANIKAWCERHALDPDALRRSRSKPEASQELAPPPPRTPTNALERLLGAQDPDIARRLIIPADIALALSRMP